MVVKRNEMLFRRVEYMPVLPDLPRIEDSLTAIQDALLSDGPLLLWGEMGAGKSTLAALLGRALSRHGWAGCCIAADPGSPAFGVPGALCLAQWRKHGWDPLAFQALCSLDAARFRLPLIRALRHLADRAPTGPLLIDAPGVSRGVAGAELLPALIDAAGAGTLVVLVRAGHPLPLAQELAALPVRVVQVAADPAARRPDRRARAAGRTRLWDAYLKEAVVRRLDLGRLQVTGTPPPVVATHAWSGRQVALLDGGQATLTLGEVLEKRADTLLVRMPETLEGGESLLVRDAWRSGEGLVETAPHLSAGPRRKEVPPDLAPPERIGALTHAPPMVRLGAASALLVNGPCDDPLLHLRLRHQRRSLLFDLGDARRLPARIAHQVTDVFISHAHIDHIGGFLWLLRARIGEPPVCRLYGPPGTAGHIEGLIAGILWDRIGDRGPAFLITELWNTGVRRFQVQAGVPGHAYLGEQGAASGLLLDAPGFRVRAETLDHGTPVLAFAFETHSEFNIRKERLLALGLSPGPWLSMLKRHLAEGQRELPVSLPDGRSLSSGALAKELVLERPGQKLVYATDLADSADNRRRLVALAAGAHSLFCEAPFAESHRAQARATGHLTARACGEIAVSAGVQRLIPFHFSRRYEDDPGRIYAQVRAACPGIPVLEQGPAANR